MERFHGYEYLWRHRTHNETGWQSVVRCCWFSSPLSRYPDRRTSPAAGRWCSSRSHCYPRRLTSDRASPRRSSRSGPECRAWWGRWTYTRWSQGSLGSYPKKNMTESENRAKRLCFIKWLFFVSSFPTNPHTSFLWSKTICRWWDLHLVCLLLLSQWGM